MAPKKRVEPRTPSKPAARAGDPEDFFQNAAMPLHWVRGDGIILRANKAELELLGYTAEEYIGRHIADFHVDPAAIEDILQRLARGETIKGYEACLRHADGSVRYVLIDSNVLWGPDGEFLHTRCFTRDITNLKLAEDARRAIELRFEALAGIAPVGLFRTDASGDCVYVNTRWYEITGLLAEEALGKGWSRTLHPDDRERVFEEWYQAASEHREFSAKYRFKRPDGTTRWVIGRALPEHDAIGVVVGYVGTVADITEQNAHQQELAFLADASRVLTSSLDYEATLQAVARLAVPLLSDWCGVHVVNPDGMIRCVAIAHTNRRTEEVGRQLLERYPPKPTGKLGVPKVLRTGEAILHSDFPEWVLARVAGSAADLEILRGLGMRSLIIVPMTARGRTLGTITLLAAESGRRYGDAELRLAQELGHRAAFAVDNARLYREAETRRQEAERARLEAEATNRTKDEFLATLSHELRTPLNAMLGWARLLLAGALDATESHRGLEIIERNAASQARIITDLLDVSRIVSGRMSLEPCVVNLGAVVDVVVDSVALAANAKGIRVSVDGEPGVTMWGDPARLQQIVWNLLSNAVKFTPQDGRVTVQVRRGDNHIRIIVSDTGAGIAKEFLPHLFERFRQADSSTTRRHAGLGLGLSIVRELVSLHGGTIVAESAGEGQGSTFTIDFPASASDGSGAAIALANDRTSSSPEASGGLAGVRVLVVDDDSDTRELLRVTLTQQGAETVAVNTAASALEALKRARLDVLVSDIAMPGLDGYELIAALRSKPPSEGGAVPALALSAYASPEARQRALLAGFQMYLPKPVDPVELVRAVASLCAIRRA